MIATDERKPRPSNLIIFDGVNKNEVRQFIREKTNKSTMGGAKRVYIVDGDITILVNREESHVIVEDDGTIKVLNVFDYKAQYLN